MLLVNSGKVVRAIHTSTGIGGDSPDIGTPPGKWKIYRKEVRSWSVPYKTWLPYAAYWVGGWALHGYADVPASPRRTAARDSRCRRRRSSTTSCPSGRRSGSSKVLGMEASEPRRRRPAIVAVDDEPAVLAAVARDLRRQFGERYRIVRATRGAEALTALKELVTRGEQVALLVADQRMPRHGRAPSTWSRRASSCRTPSASC